MQWLMGRNLVNRVAVTAHSKGVDETCFAASVARIVRERNRRSTKSHLARISLCISDPLF